MSGHPFARPAGFTRSVCAALFTAALLAPPARAEALGALPSPATARMQWTRWDTRAGLVSLAAVLVTGAFDEPLQDRLAFAGGESAQKLADVMRPLGTPIVWAPALLVVAGAGHVSGRSEWVGASARIAVSAVIPAVATQLLKVSAGRSRPEDSPEDPYDFDPFTRDASFPSGHTTLAFAVATAIARETRSRWVPWVGYPVAALVGWSRVHDNEHWASDVVGGAAVGTWLAAKSEDWLRARRPASASTEPFVSVSGGSLVLGLVRRY